MGALKTEPVGVHRVLRFSLISTYIHYCSCTLVQLYIAVKYRTVLHSFKREPLFALSPEYPDIHTGYLFCTSPEFLHIAPALPGHGPPHRKLVVTSGARCVIAVRFTCSSSTPGCFDCKFHPGHSTCSAVHRMLHFSHLLSLAMHHLAKSVGHPHLYCPTQIQQALTSSRVRSAGRRQTSTTRS